MTLIYCIKRIEIRRFYITLNKLPGLRPGRTIYKVLFSYIRQQSPTSQDIYSPVQPTIKSLEDIGINKRQVNEMVNNSLSISVETDINL